MSKNKNETTPASAEPVEFTIVETLAIAAETSKKEPKEPPGPRALFNAVARRNEDRGVQVIRDPTFDAANIVNSSVGGSELIRAAKEGLPRIVRALLDREDFNLVEARDNLQCWTALHFAAHHGNHEICDDILNHPRFNAMNARDSLGRTALHLAAQRGNTEVIRVFANCQRFTGQAVKDIRDRTALDLSFGEGRAILIKRRASIGPGPKANTGEEPCETWQLG